MESVLKADWVVPMYHFDRVKDLTQLRAIGRVDYEGWWSRGNGWRWGDGGEAGGKNSESDFAIPPRPSTNYGHKMYKLPSRPGCVGICV